MPMLTAVRNLARRALEAIVGPDLSSDPDYEPGFRRISGGKNRRDLDPASQEEMRRVCRWLYDAQPLAAWIVDMPVDLILGDELGYTVEIDAERAGLETEQAKKDLEKQIKRTLDRFWEHPAFNIRLRADELFTVYRLDGELCLPIADQNDMDGVPVLDFLDASLIAGVEPYNGSSLIAGRVKLRTAPGDSEKALDIIKLNPKAQRLEGQAFYFGNSHIPNAMRGRSELLRVADWIDMLDQFLFARGDRAGFMNAFLYDVTLKSTSATDLKKRADEIRKHPPQPGTYNVHNDSEDWKAITPDLKSEDATGEVKLLRNYILGSKSIPESWYADGGDATRTTAGEQNAIALMALKRLRKRALTIFGTMLEFAYDSAQAKQATFPNRLAAGIKLRPDLPPLDEKDISRLGGVVQNIEAALDLAVANEHVSARTARKVFLHIMDRLGVPVDADDEARQIETEGPEREKKAAAAANDAMRTALQQMPRPGVNEPNPADPKDPADKAA